MKQTERFIVSLIWLLLITTSILAQELTSENARWYDYTPDSTPESLVESFTSKNKTGITKDSTILSNIVQQSNSFVYVNNNVPGANSVSGFMVNPDGTLTALAGSPFSTAGNGGGLCNDMDSIAVDRLHGFVYATNSLSNTVAGFKINANGTLTPVSSSPFSTVSLTIGAAVDPLGRFVYVANHNGASVSVYAIGVSGQLTPV